MKIERINDDSKMKKIEDLYVGDCFSYSDEDTVKMKPLNGEIDNVLNKITTELKSVKEKWWYGVDNDCFIKLLDVLDIIDKYKTESEAAEQ